MGIGAGLEHSLGKGEVARLAVPVHKKAIRAIGTRSSMAMDIYVWLAFCSGPEGTVDEQVLAMLRDLRWQLLADQAAEAES